MGPQVAAALGPAPQTRLNRPRRTVSDMTARLHPEARRAEALRQFRALRGTFPRAAASLDVARGIERGYPPELLNELAKGL